MISRRSVLKAMLTVPFISKPATLCALSLPKMSVTSLKVYVHGLFAHIYNESTEQIELLPPIVRMPGHSHIYRAGSFTPPDKGHCDDHSIHEPDLLQGEEYRLHLENYVNEGSFPDLPYDSAACLWTKTLSLDKSLCFCTISLPQTDQLQLKHRVKRNDGRPIFEGPDVTTFHIRPSSLARTFVFTYQNPLEKGKSDPFQPVLLDKNDNEIWRPKDDSGLHIFAEPPHSLKAKQERLAVQAFDRVRAMLGIQLYPVPFTIQSYDAVKDDEKVEELSTGERETKICGVDAGGEVMNCVGVVVNLQQ